MHLKKDGGGERDGQTTGGMWSAVEAEEHINVLELKAILFVLLALCKEVKNSTIMIMSDNSTCVACINRKGSTKCKLQKLVKEIWLWAIKNNNFLTSTHLPGTKNIEADEESRKDRHNIEWELERCVFVYIMEHYGWCNIDMFASRVNAQLDRYVSWEPDPFAYAINCFSLNWGTWIGYCFPPFSLITRILKKVEEDKAECTLVCPIWSTQVWFSRLLNMLKDSPVLLPCRKQLIVHPYTKLSHPMLPKLRMMACRISGVRSKREEFQRNLQRLSWQPGETALKRLTLRIVRDGSHFVNKGRLIPLTEHPKNL